MIYFAFGWRGDEGDGYHVTVADTHVGAVREMHAACGEMVDKAWMGTKDDAPDADEICETCLDALGKLASEQGEVPKLASTPRPRIEPPV